jgi:monoterpene epsilon-lactone hydrolase
MMVANLVSPDSIRRRGEGAAMVSPQAQAEIERMLADRAEAARHPVPPRTIQQDRDDWEAASSLTPLPPGARFEAVDAGGVAAEWVEMAGVRRDTVVLQLHGGGYTSGSPLTHRKLATSLSRAANARVLTPAYRLAPEYPFPAALEDALRVFDWLLVQGIANGRIIVAGDSAGGGLALSLLIALRDAGASLPRGAVLISAWTDLTLSGASHDALRDIDLQITREGLRSAAELYMSHGNLADPRASTLFADLAGLPPLLFQVGSAEVLLDDSRRFVERARAAGVDATLKVYDLMWHVFQFQAPELPEAQAAMDDIAAFIRAQLGD